MALTFYQRISLLILVLLLMLNHKIGYSQKVQSNSIEISFFHYVGNQFLKLDSVIYKNALNQDFAVTKFKYYIANIALSRKEGKPVKYNNYFLIDEEKPGSKKVVLENIPDGEYVSVNFTIGVDSIYNCSGAQSGALDPINGMFWTWNTGYIFMKLEGSSEFSSAPNALLEYHIGGFKSPNNAIQHGHFDFGSSLLKVKPTATPQVHAYVDIAKFFNAEHGGTNLSVATLPTWTMPGANAVMLAGNFHHAFVFDHIHN